VGVKTVRQIGQQLFGEFGVGERDELAISLRTRLNLTRLDHPTLAVGPLEQKTSFLVFG
jgi:hypothetical protein